MPLIRKVRTQRKNILTLLVAFLLACTLWYLVVGSEQVESQIELRLDFRSLPEEYMILGGLETTIKARLQGPSELVNALQGKDLVHTIDLSQVKEGANVFPIDLGQSMDLRAFEVVNVDPYRVILDVGKVFTKTVPLELIAENINTSDMTIDIMELSPSSVTIIGTQQTLGYIHTLNVTFVPYAELEAGLHTLNLSITAPEQVEIFPPVTTLTYEVFLNREEYVLELPIQLKNVGLQNFELNIKTAKIILNIPASKIQEGLVDPEYLKGIIPYVTVPESTLGSVRLLLFVDIPKTAELVSVEPSNVTINTVTKE